MSSCTISLSLKRSWGLEEKVQQHGSNSDVGSRAVSDPLGLETFVSFTSPLPFWFLGYVVLFL